MKTKKPCYHPPLAKVELSEQEVRRRDIAKHNRVRKRIMKEFKKMPFVALTPHESLAQRTISKARQDRMRKDRRLWKKKKK